MLLMEYFDLEQHAQRCGTDMRDYENGGREWRQLDMGYSRPVSQADSHGDTSSF